MPPGLCCEKNGLFNPVYSHLHIVLCGRFSGVFFKIMMGLNRRCDMKFVFEIHLPDQA